MFVRAYHIELCEQHVDVRMVGRQRVSSCRAVNTALARYPEARRRHLQLHTPIILAVWPQARLVQEEESNMTYGEVYEANCLRCNRAVDKPVLFFKEHVHGNLPLDRKRTQPPSPACLCLRCYLPART
jgi:hypothetical protein